MTWGDIFDTRVWAERAGRGVGRNTDRGQGKREHRDPPKGETESGDQRGRGVVAGSAGHGRCEIDGGVGGGRRVCVKE